MVCCVYAFLTLRRLFRWNVPTAPRFIGERICTSVLRSYPDWLSHLKTSPQIASAAATSVGARMKTQPVGLWLRDCRVEGGGEGDG